MCREGVDRRVEHDDNNEDHGCADVIYNLYRLIITRNISCCVFI